jgi:acyl-CoA synthetase (NDP forming)
MVINMLKSTFFEPRDALAVVKTAAEYGDKPVVDVPAGGEDFAFVQKVLKNTLVPVYNLPEKAAKVLRVLRLYCRVKEKGVEV